MNNRYAVCLETASFEQQSKEVEYAYFDLSIFGKLVFSETLEQMEAIEKGEKNFCNFGLVRIGGRYHLMDHQKEDGQLKFYEYDQRNSFIVNIRQENFNQMKQN